MLILHNVRIHKQRDDISGKIVSEAFTMGPRQAALSLGAAVLASATLMYGMLTGNHIILIVGPGVVGVSGAVAILLTLLANDKPH